MSSLSRLGTLLRKQKQLRRLFAGLQILNGLEAGFRAFEVGTLLDQGSEPGKFYDGVNSGPIAPSTIGYKLNIGAMLWF